MQAARFSGRKATAVLRTTRLHQAAEGGWQRHAAAACPGFSSISSHDEHSTTGNSEPKKHRSSDPTAKRPNQVCDPYGQSGKPLSFNEADSLCSTIHCDWKLETIEQSASAAETSLESSIVVVPFALTREFVHPSFLSGTRFLHSVAAVAELNAHFPSLHLERRIVKKTWHIVSTVRCHTTVLGGLAIHDFHLAMVRFSASNACIHSLLFRCLCSHLNSMQ
jgi:pterin-4a-carbinolamine dehydratase